MKTGSQPLWRWQRFYWTNRNQGRGDFHACMLTLFAGQEGQSAELKVSLFPT
jgi:hypothetical protein